MWGRIGVAFAGMGEVLDSMGEDLDGRGWVGVGPCQVRVNFGQYG